MEIWLLLCPSASNQSGNKHHRTAAHQTGYQMPAQYADTGQTKRAQVICGQPATKQPRQSIADDTDGPFSEHNTGDDAANDATEEANKKGHKGLHGDRNQSIGFAYSRSNSPACFTT